MLTGSPKAFENLVAFGIRKGWVRPAGYVSPIEKIHFSPKTGRDKRIARMCMARLRAERAGLPTDKFPKRERVRA